MDFDWLGNPSVVINLVISAVVFGGFGCLTVWLTGPDSMSIKTILAGGLVPVIASLIERLRKSPSVMNTEERIKEGAQVDRRHN